MNLVFYLIIFILSIICFLCVIKLYFMKKSIKEIEASLENIIKTDTNSIITISSSDEDIKRLANKLNKELDKLKSQRNKYESGNQELKKTITNISHDMRTPLTAMSGYIDVIKNGENKAKQGEYLEVVERKTNELVTLTEQLFNFSKAVDIGIKKEECCINEILEETIANYYNIFKEKDITPKIEMCEEKVYKFIDRNAIMRVFENILSNAIKYSNGDLRIVLDSNGKITFSNKANSLDTTTVQKLFDRYYTVENGTNSSGLRPFYC